MFQFVKKLFSGREKGSPPATTEKLNPDTTPDSPYPFGYKTAWYAVRDRSREDVIEKLGLSVSCESNWEFGIGHIYESDDLFVSPETDGFYLVVGLSGLLKNDELETVRRHAALFEELQYFKSHRVIDAYTWARFLKGEVYRAYAFLGESGEVCWDEGSLTEEEAALGFGRFPNPENWESAEDFPDEESVMEIAKAWGVDPTFSEGEYAKATGYLCRFGR